MKIPLIAASVAIAVVACLSVVFTESPSHAKTLPQDSGWTSHRLPAAAGSKGKPFAAEAANCPAATVCYVVGDSFDDFSEVELKIKQNREMVFVVRMPTAPLTGDLLALDDLEKSESKIKRL